jgi:hypothetical protein
MDIRNTIITSESFLPILKEHFNNQEKVSLLIDKEGITRAEDLIDKISYSENPLESVITLKDGLSFKIKELIAVNGLFRSDYSEC